MQDGLALLDLHRGQAPALERMETLAADGLARIISADEYATMARHAWLREQAADLEHERHELRMCVVWPWRLRWRRRRIEQMGARLREWHAEARELRRQLHALGLARERPEQYVRLDDGRYAAPTPQGVDALYAWAYSDACDGLIEPVAGRDHAAACMSAYARMVAHWRVAYPAPILGTTAAMLCAAPASELDATLERSLALVDHWVRRLRTCPADRIAVAAPIALACQPNEDPLAVAGRAEGYQERLRAYGFPRQRETMWAGAWLMLHGFPVTRLGRVYDLWRRMVAVGWSMSAATYPYAARLALVRGRPVEVAIRVERIYREMAERAMAEGRAKAVAASILAHSDLYPTARHGSARLMEARSVYADMVDRMMALRERLPRREDSAWGDSRLAAAAILALMPGSLERVWEAFALTLEALREAAGPRVPRAGPAGIDPLTGAALLLCDRAWGGRVSHQVFAFEACAACCPESWDELTMFRLTAPGGPAWTKRE
ncbi:MAG: hypothetical protein AB7Y46_09225 [Armatimonadota bacterium]